MVERIIDGKDAVLGRLASYIAKEAMKGDKINIINCNDIRILGDKIEIIEKYKKKIKMGGSSLKGPKIIRSPERIVKRTIRGMLSHKQERGKVALKNIRCYNLIPKELKDEKTEKIKIKSSIKYIKLNELVNKLK
jgi:large subunit ribosomal protein L13